MAPFVQIIPSTEEGKEPEVRTADIAGLPKSDEERKLDAMRARQEEREAERYGRLVAQPPQREVIVISKETQQLMDDQAAEKAKVANVVTTHSDIAKVAAGSDVALVPTVRVYTEDEPMEGDVKMEVSDPTVVSRGIVQGESILDRAESSLRQPQGDEYSAKSATGPELPEGQAAVTVDGGEETEPAFDPEASAADRRETIQEQNREAAEAAQKVQEDQDKALGFDPNAPKSQETVEVLKAPATGTATPAPTKTSTSNQKTSKGKGR